MNDNIEKLKNEDTTPKVFVIKRDSIKGFFRELFGEKQFEMKFGNMNSHDFEVNLPSELLLPSNSDPADYDEIVILTGDDTISRPFRSFIYKKELYDSVNSKFNLISVEVKGNFNAIKQG